MSKRAKKNENTGHIKKDNVKWSSRWDEVLLDALIEEQMKGNRPDGTFTSSAYNNVLKVITNALGFQFEKDHVKNRMKTLKNHFSACYELFKGLSGFAWNPETKLFEADNEVWKDLVEAKPSAAKWKHTQIHHYDKLLDLFAKDRATGEGAVSAKERANQCSREENMSFIDLNESGTEMFENDSHSLADTPAIANSQNASSSKVTKRKASTVDVVERQIEGITSGIKSVADAIQESNRIAEKGIAVAERARPHCYSEDEIFSELVAIGVPEFLRLDAFLFLIKRPTDTRAFFGVPQSLRLELLSKMMSSSNGSNKDT